MALLQEKGYVEAADRRYRAALHLTEDGQAIARRIDCLIARWVELGSTGVPEEDRAAFYRALEIIAGNLHEAVSRGKGFSLTGEG